MSLRDSITIISGRANIDKDPNSQLDYIWDWTAWLAPINDSITSVSFVLDQGLVLVSSNIAGPTVVAFIACTPGLVAQNPPQILKAVCRITTASNPDRVEDRTIYMRIKDL